MKTKAILLLASLTMAASLFAQAVGVTDDVEHKALIHEAVARVNEATEAVATSSTSLQGEIRELDRQYRSASGGKDRHAARKAREAFFAAAEPKIRAHRAELEKLLAMAEEAADLVAADIGVGKSAPKSEDAAAKRRLLAFDNALVGLQSIPAGSREASEAMATIAAMAETSDDAQVNVGALLLLQKRAALEIARTDAALRRGTVASLRALLDDLSGAMDGISVLDGYNAFCAEIAGGDASSKPAARRKLKPTAPSDGTIDISKPF